VIVKRWNSDITENRSDGKLNYGRFGYWKNETESSDGFPQTPTGSNAGTFCVIVIIDTNLFDAAGHLH